MISGSRLSALVAGFSGILLASNGYAVVAGGGPTKSDCYSEFQGVTAANGKTRVVLCVGSVDPNRWFTSYL